MFARASIDSSIIIKPSMPVAATSVPLIDASAGKPIKTTIEATDYKAGEKTAV